ncbi:MAG: 6,7-dimethyl-8-ribityllumazine synthase [Acidobacteria bacterium]|nr:MAG: 6,7-dimethyl-8-ribityllumazine synthase [Acidobacteriota bacterium]
MPQSSEKLQVSEYSARDFRFAVVVSRYNEQITEKLLRGAIEALTEYGVRQENVSVFHVPGSFEIPQAARQIAAHKQFDAIICLGTLIRGETIHFQLISEECAHGIQEVAKDFGLPVTFGVITAENTDQAVARAGLKSQNKGWEAALAAIEMAGLYRKLQLNS